MDKTIMYYWQELNKRFSSNQVFLILCYWILSISQQKIEDKERPAKIEEWRFHLLEMFKESLNYNVKESAVRLSEKIEWELLENDQIASNLLVSLSADVDNFLCAVSYVDTDTKDRTSKGMIIKRLQQAMENVLQLAAINGLYSMTPDSIRKVTEALVPPTDMRSIMDLCCGSGGLGIAIWQQLNEPQKVDYCGMDIEPVMCDICTIMTYICGLPESTVILQDALRINTTEYSKKYDMVLLDVPRGQNKSIKIQEYGSWLENIEQKNIYTDWLYIMRALSVLNDCGKGIVIVTSGTLTRENEAGLRREVILNDWVEAVLTLPVNLYPNTRVGSEIIIFNKQKEKKRRKKILFLDISKYYFRNNRNFYSITEKGIDLATDIFHKYYEVQEISRIVDVSEIDEISWSLKPFPYIGMKNEKKIESPMCYLGDIAHVIRGVQLKKEEEELLCKNGTALYLNIKDIKEGEIHFEEAKMISPKSKDWHMKFGICEDDILITSKGTSLKIAIVGEDPPKAYISGNLTILRVNKAQYHPYILFEFLTSKDGIRTLESIQSGTTIRVLSNANLERLQIPMYNQEVMSQVGKQLKDKRQKYEAEKKQLVDNYTMERKILLELIGIEA